MIRPYRTSRLFRRTWTASTTDSIDLKDGGISGPITRLGFRFAGDVVATGAGVSAPTLDNPLGLISGVRLQIVHMDLGHVTIYDGDPRDLHWMSSFLAGGRAYMDDPSPGASATDQFGVYFEIPLSMTRLGMQSYLDPRDIAAMNLTFTHAPITGYAGAGVSAINNATVDVYATEILDEGAPPKGAPHFIPRITTLRQAIESQATDIPASAMGGGFMPWIHYRVHDDSQAGDLERSDQILRRLKMVRAGRRLFESDWTNLLEGCRSVYPLSGSGAGPATSQPAGVAMWEPDTDAAGLSMLDCRNVALYHLFDTSTAAQQDVGAGSPATATTSDAVFINAMTLVPNVAAASDLAGAGLGAK